MQMYQRILSSINLLIENSKEMQDNKFVQEDLIRSQMVENNQSIKEENRDNNWHQISPLHFAKEYCTIKVCTARRTGHTTAINEFLMDKYHNCHEKWATICYNQKMVENNKTYKELLANKSNKKSDIHFMTQNTFDNSIRGQELDGIIVDCATFMSQKKIDHLYTVGMACMKNKKHKFFIFVE